MKKINYTLMSLVLLAFAFSLEAASERSNGQNAGNKRDGSTQEKFDIMERNQNEDTDTLAIPLDDSEVEDEEEIDYAEGEDEFDLPQYDRKLPQNDRNR